MESSRGFIISYTTGTKFLEKLTGATKVKLFFSSIFLVMLTFDLRVILPSFILHFLLVLSLKPSWEKIKYVAWFVIIMNLINVTLFYLVQPLIGTEMAGSVTELFRFNNHYIVTGETIVYLITRLLKIYTTFLISLWFVLSITPSQLASDLYACKIPYKICTIVSLGLRYMPDILRDYQSIHESMQMRGVELDKKKVSLFKRLKNGVAILLPLIIVSFEKVDVISNAMDLRGYGQLNVRSYYSELDPTSNDQKMMLLFYFQLAIGISYMLYTFLADVQGLWYPW